MRCLLDICIRADKMYTENHEGFISYYNNQHTIKILDEKGRSYIWILNKKMNEMTMHSFGKCIDAIFYAHPC